MEADDHVTAGDAPDAVGRRPLAVPSRGAASDRRPPERLSLPVADLVARARGLIQPGRRVMLGITGAPGAGKSTVAEALGQALGVAAVIVGMDGFHLAQAELRRLGRQDRKGAPDTFDSRGYAALLNRLRDGTEPAVYAPVFRRDLEEPIGSCLRIDRTVPLVVTEGNYLLLDGDGWADARRQLDEIWYLDLPDHIRQQRLLLRHHQFGKDPGTARRWVTGSDQANADIIRVRQDYADLIVTIID